MSLLPHVHINATCMNPLPADARKLQYIAFCIVFIAILNCHLHVTCMFDYPLRGLTYGKSTSLQVLCPHCLHPTGGQPGECCGCSSEPSMCAGSTECEVTFSAKQRQRCVWVKIDNDDSPTDDKR